MMTAVIRKSSQRHAGAVEQPDPSVCGLRRAVLISASYPPRGGSGVQRVYYQSENLAEFGVEMHVVTTSSDECWVRDETMRPVFVSADNIHQLPQYVVHWPRRIMWFVNRIFRRLLFPDMHAIWAITAYRKCVEIVTAQKVECVLLSLGRRSLFLTVLLLKRSFPDLKIVVDVRDLRGAVDQRMSVWSRLTGLNWMDEWLEHAAFSQASAVTVVSDGLAEYIKEKHERGHELPVHVIQNGFADEVFQSAVPLRPREKKIVLRHIGFLSDIQKVSQFMGAVARLRSEDDQHLQDCIIEFVGGNPRFSKELAQQSSVDDIVESKGYVTHRESASLMMGADILLLFWAPGKGTVGGKLYEYLRADRFILAFDQGNRDGQRILESSGRGEFVPVDDIDAQVHVLKRLIRALRSGGTLLPDSLPSISEYSRNAQNRELYQVMKDVVTGDGE